ncbi:MAG: tetratricopeptide repeat protein [Thermoplasmata archaeon]
MTSITSARLCTAKTLLVVGVLQVEDDLMQKTNRFEKDINEIIELIKDKNFDKDVDLASIRDTDDWLNLGIYFGQNRAHDIAEKIFDLVTKLKPNLARAWSNRGIALRFLGRYLEAIQCYDKALNINPYIPETWSNKGIALRHIEKYREAIECYDLALEIKPNLVEAWFNKGIALGYLKEYDKEIECYDKALDLNPNFAEIWYYKGTAFGNLGKYKKEIKCYDEVIKIKPKFAEAWHYKGAALAKLGRYEDAVRCYNNAVKIKPWFAEAWSNKGTALAKLKKHEVAVISYEKALKINPKLAEAWSNKGTALGYLGKYEKAIECYEKALKINPKLAEVWSNKGTALRDLGKYKEAIECYDEAIKIKPMLDEAWYNKGKALEDIGDYEGAVRCYDEAIRIDPKLVEAWHNKGKALSNTGNYEEAIECYDKAIKIKPKTAEIWYDKGTALRKKGKKREAVKYYDRAVKIKPDFAKALYDNGRTLHALGRYEEALERYDKALEIMPDFANAYCDKGVTQTCMGKYEDALRSYDNALDIEQDFPEALSNKGTALTSMERYGDAVECFERAIKINPDLCEAWFNRGTAFAKAGQNKDAVECYDEAAKIKPDIPETYGNKGVALLNLCKYNEAKKDFKRAKKLFFKNGNKIEGKRARRYELLAENASNLISDFKPLDQHIKDSLDCSSLTELKEGTEKVHKDIEDIFKDYEKIELTKDANKLLNCKKNCLTVLWESLNFRKTSFEELDDARSVFRESGHVNFIRAVNSLENFVHTLKKYEDVEEIPDFEEKILLQDLKISQALNGELTEELIKAKFFDSVLFSKRTEKKPKIIHEYLEEPRKDWVRFCLVQLNFSVDNNGRSYALKEKEHIKNKVFQALDTAVENDVDLVCFPELSFDQGWTEEMVKDKYKDIIILGGSYRNQGYNISPIVIRGSNIEPPYKKICPSPFENPEVRGGIFKSGEIIYAFETECGRFSFLTCADYATHGDLIHKYKKNGFEGVNFVIITCYDQRSSKYQPRFDSDCEDYGIDIIQVNRDGENYGNSCVIGREHDSTMDKSKKDEVRYKIFQLEGEVIGIVDLNINRSPPTDDDMEDTRFRKTALYEYKEGEWSPLSGN